jgi:hypothetical protein
VTVAEPTPSTPTTATVEAAVRHQLSTALGGGRGMLEAAIPTALFTAVFLIGDDLRTAVLASVAAAVVLLVVRLVQRSSPQFVLNAFLGIGIGAFFAWRAARGGGDQNDQALAYFLPGLLYNGFYSAAMVFSIVIGWPVVGFMIGSVTGDPTAWHQDKQVVRLCTRLTWLLALPCVLRVLVQGPIWLAAHAGRMEADTAVALLGVLKIGLGWPLQLAALGAMVWVLGRNQTPIEPPPEPTA